MGFEVSVCVRRFRTYISFIVVGLIDSHASVDRPCIGWVINFYFVFRRIPAVWGRILRAHMGSDVLGVRIKEY